MHDFLETLLLINLIAWFWLAPNIKTVVKIAVGELSYDKHLMIKQIKATIKEFKI